MDLIGDIASISYPNTTSAISYSYDAAGRPSSLVDSNGTTLIDASVTPPTGCPSSGVCYAPQGTVYGMSIFPETLPAIEMLYTYNNRCNPTSLRRPIAPRMSTSLIALSPLLP